MILSDCDIVDAMNHGELDIAPFRSEQLQAASYDITLGPDLLIPTATGVIYGEQLATRSHAIDPVCGYVMDPGQFLLAETVERVRLGLGIGAQVMGRSSWGRRGLSIHITAGWVDPGWNGRLTLELHNCGPAPILLMPGVAIGQLVFMACLNYTTRPYKGRYSGAKGVEASKLVVVGDKEQVDGEKPAAY